ncbi:MAG: HD domain-containing protein [Candidatus Nitrosotenuis sp.]|uniref:HD domain-containing protein n=1 Tax=Candidatus Nitrosotenuis uzonensis TaxID=1407055 RepID=A0A812F6P4_9ARCH|nr:HD domain-containing protein [Candidatus Nitrosotenuis uzonensis]CAE6500818.1 conserved hypothetical protein [Candidatus Nitrosotenuis uzonensis]
MDPIHGFIDVSVYPVIEELVESKYFQRLRRIGQLGLTHSVYPNATHSRFAHCLGVMKTFLILFDSIMSRSDTFSDTKKEELRKLGAVTALLHDLGHGPFSHAFETIVKNEKFHHEEMTKKIIQTTEIHTILKDNKIKSNDVSKILGHKVGGDHRILTQLISSQLDADRLDYLLRDSYFTGVNYGKIDVFRIANTLEIRTDKNPKSLKNIAVVSPKGMGAVEDYIVGRYLMYKNVYFHRVVRCMECLLDKVFLRASEISDKKTKLREFVNLKKEITTDTLYGIDDARAMSMIYRWSNSSDAVLKDLAQRVILRQKLTSTEIPYEKYVDASANLPDMSLLHKDFGKSGYPSKYYYVVDNMTRSGYTPYSIDKHDDELSYLDNIITYDENRKPIDVSTKSTIISALATKKSDAMVIFHPSEMTSSIKRTFNV